MSNFSRAVSVAPCRRDMSSTNNRQPNQMS
jgi:hypothetical protein